MCINLQRTFRGFAAVCGATAMLGGAAALSNIASAQTPAAAPAAPTATPWTYQGLFDVYYLYDANKPEGFGATGTPSQVTGFEYDERASAPTLSLAELNIAKAPPAAGGLGFKTTIIAGDTAALNHDNFTAYTGTASNQEARFQNIQQLYGTYAFANGAGVDFGKFYTPFGYEVTESNANYNYSRSFIFTDLLPVYHLGLRAYTPNYKGLVLTGWLVRGINNADSGSGDAEGVYDKNKNAGFIGQINYVSPTGKFTVIESYGGSHDGPEDFTDKVLLSDTDITVTPNAVDTYGLNYTNREDSFSGSSSDGTDGVQDNGYAFYYRRQITAPYAAALRLEKVFSKSSAGDPHLDSITLTLEDKATKSLLTRLEFRHDDGPSGVFVSGPKGTGATQNTVSLSAVWTFGP